MTRKGPCLAECSAITILKLLMIFCLNVGLIRDNGAPVIHPVCVSDVVAPFMCYVHNAT